MLQSSISPTQSAFSYTPTSSTDIFYHCPVCNNFSLIPEVHILNPAIMVVNCKNNHSIELTKDNISTIYPKIKQKSFENLRCDFCSQHQTVRNVPFSFNINEKKFICNDCKNKNKNKIFEINRNKYIQIDKLYNHCLKHGKNFVGYCFDCSQNFCNDCQTHKFCTRIVHFYSIFPDKKKINDFISEICKNLSLIQNEERKVNDVIVKIKTNFENIRTFIKLKNEFFLRVIQTYNHIFASIFNT